MSVKPFSAYDAMVAEAAKRWPYELKRGHVDRQALVLAEEVGEFIKAWRRYSGRARVDGTPEEVAEELADVIITAELTAVYLDIDLHKEVYRKLGKIAGRGGL